MATFKLLTIGNPKTRKGEAHGYLTAVLHLAPANVAGFGTVCANATPGCMASCLNTAGRGGIFKAGATSNAVQEARKRRTAFYMTDRKAFLDALAVEIRQAHTLARKHGLELAVRCNGTSDLPAIAHDMVERFRGSGIRFYDYTKHPATWLRQWDNYHLTFSLSERNLDAALDVLHRGGANVAVVFDTPRGKPLPDRYLGFPVIDGDATDLRFLDPTGVIVGLRAKGRARKDTTGFVVRVNG